MNEVFKQEGIITPVKHDGLDLKALKQYHIKEASLLECTFADLYDTWLTWMDSVGLKERGWYSWQHIFPVIGGYYKATMYLPDLHTIITATPPNRLVLRQLREEYHVAHILPVKKVALRKVWKIYTDEVV